MSIEVLLIIIIIILVCGIQMIIITPKNRHRLKHHMEKDKRINDFYRLNC